MGLSKALDGAFGKRKHRTACHRQPRQGTGRQSVRVRVHRWLRFAADQLRLLFIGPSGRQDLAGAEVVRQRVAAEGQLAIDPDLAPVEDGFGGIQGQAAAVFFDFQPIGQGSTGLLRRRPDRQGDPSFGLS